MTTRDRIKTAAQAILDAGETWRDYLASLGTIAEQAQHFTIARATMTKLRHLRREGRASLEPIVAGTCSVDQMCTSPNGRINYKDELIEALRAEQDRLHRDVRDLKAQIAWLQLSQFSRPVEDGPVDRKLLRKLQTICHPDKWSQGQPATALAHELTIVLNTLRATPAA